MMRVAYLKAPLLAEVRDQEVPVPSGSEVLVRVARVGICGSDVQSARRAGDWERWGHEFSGVVESVGPQVSRFQPGDQVVWVPVIPCHRCRRCLAGEPLMCLNMRARPCMGAAEYVCDPEDFWLAYEGLSAEQAAMAEPLTVAIDLVEEAGVGLGDTVLVVGGGAIGLMAARICRLRGAGRVLVAEPAESTAKIGLARAWGLDTVPPGDGDMPAAVREVSPEGADAVLLTAPPATLPAAIACCAFGATVALIGTAYGGADRVALDVNDFHFRNIRIQGANNCPVMRFTTAFDLMRRGAMDVEGLLTHTFPLEECGRALDTTASQAPAVIKAMLTL